ncbi:UDP-glucoronosyl and UDP-glucosyl transferase [Sulfidibacter corallicola]|uniref:Erythromycin biosynthesis protein CIII-like C-terminal domain-containing protein n=1 Tax=Sulfidibacter corallicola TaxID=2818388 RepID=A0A8A4TPW9_SULCO|nr:nucleotide disphospho-sugar-binding domain-containing protein [Sulfidibacter corallicola]QTD51234.1 hypothetical protein J3U87_02090 [Sulfidibacter corallicola]
MATIGFCVLPMSGPMNGSLPLAKRLRSRGHHVVFFGMPDCEAFVAPFGFEFLPIYADWFPKNHLELFRSGGKGPLTALLQHRRFIMHYRDYFKYLIRGGETSFLATMDQLNPDLVIIDGSIRPTWSLLAYRAGLPAMYLHTTMPPKQDPMRPPIFSTLQPGDPQIAKAWRKYYRQRFFLLKVQSAFGVGFDWIRYTRKLAARYGYPLEKLNDRAMFSVFLDFPEIILYPRDFEMPGPVADDVYHVAAPADEDRSEQAFPFECLDPNKPLIYASLGSIHANATFARTIRECAVKRPDLQWVLTTGKHLNIDQLAPIPANLTAVPFAPQLALLQRAAVMITHGGANSIRECIQHEVPMVVFPLTFDQPGTAARVVYHGLGLMGRIKGLQAESLLPSIDRVLDDPSFRAKLAAMNEAFRKSRESEAAVKVIEDRLASIMEMRNSGEVEVPVG